MCQHTVSGSSFNIGLRFYYWAFYEELNELPDKEQVTYNQNDHSGHDISSLLIKPKYNSLKQEISEYAYITMLQYEQEIIIKAKLYENSNIVKGTKARGAGGYGIGDWLHYDIVKGTVLGLPNLLSLILYCDYTDLSSAFSATFRKQTPFEAVQSIKARNSKYYWMSKILRETVEIYGKCSFGDYVEGDGYINTLSGPYYCGMWCVLNMPSFNLRLCSPTSTSVHLEVAMKFSGDEGIILQINNPRTHQYQQLRGFNCSWLSRYFEEDER